MLHTLFLLSAGMILCAGGLAAAAALADLRRREYLAFALLCIPCAAFVLATDGLYSAANLAEAAAALRVQTAVGLLAAPLFFAFIAFYTRQAQWVTGLVAVFVAFAALIAWNLARPYGLRFSSLAPAAPLVLPWGDVVPRFRGELDPGPQAVMRLMVSGFLVWAAWRCVVMHRTGARGKAWFLGACLAVYLASTLHGFLVDAGRIDFVYVTPLAFLTFVLLIAVRLVLDLRDANAALLHRATHDPTTGLPNRSWLEERLAAALQRATRGSAGSALLIVNIDHFKLVNATYGHEVADRFLRLLGARIGEAVPDGELAALGGDEFAVLLNHAPGVEQAKLAAREAAGAIAVALRRPFALDEREIRASASIGIVGLSDPTASAADVMRLAGVAMLDAKSRGRARFATYESGMEIATQRRAQLDHALREAVERGSFQLRYQPQLDFAGRMIGAEVLVRWHHPVHGDVSPAEFIPIAEQTGLIHGVGEWVRAQSCRRLAAPTPAPPPLWRLAVNLSPWELVRPSFPERVERLLGETGADPLRLMFELTEGVMLHRLEQVIENMSRLRALGVRFSIDDFGTGYSSLAYLRELPLDQLKIDKVFVAGLEHPGNRALVRSIAEIGAALDLEVVAEGIETEMQRELLFGLGCDAVQGFLLAKPMPEAEFLAFASRCEPVLPAPAEAGRYDPAMIIDCHGHYTTAPPALAEFRTAQLAEALEPGRTSTLADPVFSDDEIRATVEGTQLKRARERGIDLTIFSPRASAMGHHAGNEATSIRWARICNDLIHRIVAMYPRQFAAVCQLPQSPGVAPARCIPELVRCVEELGFVGCNLNPDASGGYWKDLPLTDRIWYPLYEKMVELDVPAMVHVSASCNPNFHATGAHYLNADTTAFMQFLLSDLFRDFPTLRFVIPHGGGAVPYHWGRFRGLGLDQGRVLEKQLLGNVFFDTCVYHQAGIDLLTRVVPVENILFASETFGAITSLDPDTGHLFDDTRRYIEAAALTPEARRQIYEGNARRVYPRLRASIVAGGGAP